MMRVLRLHGHGLAVVTAAAAAALVACGGETSRSSVSQLTEPPTPTGGTSSTVGATSSGGAAAGGASSTGGALGLTGGDSSAGGSSGSSGGDVGAGGEPTGGEGGAAPISGCGGGGGDDITRACDGKPAGSTACVCNDVWSCDATSGLLLSSCASCVDGKCAEAADPCPSYLSPLIDCVGDCDGGERAPMACMGATIVTVADGLPPFAAGVRVPAAANAIACANGAGHYASFTLAGADARVFVTPPWTLVNGSPGAACAGSAGSTCLMSRHSDVNRTVVAITKDGQAQPRNVYILQPDDASGCPSP